MKDINCKNQTTVTSLLGLNYTQYCSLDFPGHDLENIVVNTYQECLDMCTRRTPVCYGVSFRQSDSRCFWKDSTVLDSSPVVNTNIASALILQSQIKKSYSDIQCPYPNLSKQTTEIGAEFTVLCGANLDGADIYNRYSDLNKWMHAETLEECVENCINTHPLCCRITYAADFKASGWINCWMKTASRVKPRAWTKTMGHSAYITIPSIEKPVCQKDTILAKDGRSFKMSCNDYRDLNNTQIPALKAYHEKTIEGCTDRCADTNSNCSAMAFDSGLQSGFQNCYLFDSIPPVKAHSSNYTFLYHHSLSSQFTPPPPSSEFTNKAWVAGPVVGTAVGLGIIFAFYWFWYKKRSSRRWYAPVKRQ